MAEMPKQVEYMGFEKSKKIVIDHGNTKVSAVVGGKACKFRSKIEHNWAVYLEFLKCAGEIKDWAFEQTTFIFKDELKGAKMYLVDFDILNTDGTLEYHECKGWLKGSDVTKFRRVQKYSPGTKITLIMCGKAKKDQNRLRQMEKYAERIIFAPDVLGRMKGFLNFI